MEVDFDVKETGQRKTINGFDTRQAIMTIAFREKGKTLEQAGGLVVTSDIWLAPRIAAMQEVAEFELRYAKALYGPMITGASPEEMAAALALYPMLKDGLARMRDESVKLDGTAILTTTTVEAVKSEEQMAAEKKSGEAESKPSVSGGVGGLVGGFARRATQRNEAPKPRATFMTITNEVLKVSTRVAAADVGIPAAVQGSKVGRTSGPTHVRTCVDAVLARSRWRWPSQDPRRREKTQGTASSRSSRHAVHNGPRSAARPPEFRIRDRTASAQAN